MAETNSQATEQLLEHNFFGKSIEDEKQEIQKLLDQGASINAAGKRGRTILHNAMSNGSDEIIKFLLEKGADINKPDDYGETPFIRATCTRSVECVEKMLPYVDNINQVDNKKRTALMRVAAHENAVGMAALLIDNGIDVNAKDKYDEKASDKTIDCPEMYMFLVDAERIVAQQKFDRVVGARENENLKKQKLEEARLKAEMALQDRKKEEKIYGRKQTEYTDEDFYMECDKFLGAKSR